MVKYHRREDAAFVPLNTAHDADDKYREKGDCVKSSHGCMNLITPNLPHHHKDTR